MFKKTNENLPKPALGSNKENISDKVKSAQDRESKFMGKTLHTNNPTVTEDKVWSKQPTSKIFNAQGIPENAVAGINRVVKLEIFVEGKPIKFFKHFKLTQSAVKHHEFDLILAHDTLGSAENHNLEEAQSFLGKRITIIFRYKDVEQGPERNFVGVITEVGFSQEKGSLGNIVLTGFSPTILLDAAPHIQSFGGGQPMSLNSIASEVIKEGLGQEKFDFRVDARYGNVPYSSQYEETHYNYLARMAEAYGEQFFYDGEILHFGKLPPQEKPVKLVYGSNLSDVKIKMKAQHVNPTFYGYNSSQHEKLTTGASKVNHTSDIARRAYEISENTFKTPSLRIAPINASTFMDVDSSQKGTTGSKAAQVFITSGYMTVPFLYPGCIVDLEMRKTDTNDTSYFTKLMLTEVIHEVDARGYYDGHFEAIAADTGFIPRPEFHVPKAEPQVATVISNTDPLNQGRIQVQFDWQKNNTTQFIRMMSPDAGGTDQITQNRGFVAVPEVGDQVMVGFEYHHPDFPFAMGGMFHGQVGLGGGVDNHIKSIQTRSGNKVIFNDTEGSIYIEDPSGNSYLMDGKGNITVTAPKNMTFNVGQNLTVNVGQNMNTNVGADQSNIVGMNKTESITMNDSQTVGAIKNVSIGGNFMTNVVGKMMEFIKGNKESEVALDSQKVVKGERLIHSEKDHKIHSQTEINGQSNEKTNMN
ncbi:uncharacterized protein involved in type VI secretion and phage assembly [Chryseobacterium rhizosphaerae]|uniref:type VI secretion system Vgr family protein n=1 Tax=Chryseobacterium rhizosphaerae TaxID=395937 RepID=UPI00285900F1|nr:uncharacterized protein involved in type VI secretion and phage assembly [Chryseobacterium rhizosphaerae]